MMGTEFEQKSICPSCGLPPDAGHTDRCPLNPKNVERREFSIEDVVEVTDETTLKEFYIMMHQGGLHAGGKLPEELEASIKTDIELDLEKQAKGERALFAIIDKGQIIAGGKVDFQQDSNGKKWAFLEHKFVVEEYKGTRLGSLLVQKRLEAARKWGAEEAYCLVNRDNFAALRSIMKDGFELRRIEKVDTIFYATKDLLHESPNYKVRDLSDVTILDREQDLREQSYLISIHERELINTVLKAGYIGKRLITPKDVPGIKEPMLYFEK